MNPIELTLSPHREPYIVLHTSQSKLESVKQVRWFFIIISISWLYLKVKSVCYWTKVKKNYILPLWKYEKNEHSINRNIDLWFIYCTNDTDFSEHVTNRHDLVLDKFLSLKCDRFLILYIFNTHINILFDIFNVPWEFGLSISFSHRTLSCSTKNDIINWRHL